MPFLAYPAFLAAIISIIGLGRIAYAEHDRTQPRTLSELAAAQDHLLRKFQKILWLCGTLFAITMYGLLIPRTSYALPITLGWSLEYICEILAGFIPAHGNTLRLHDLLARGMSAGMLILAYAFCWSTDGAYASTEIGIAIAMSIAATLTFIDKKRFLLYELAFIFLSHISILVALLALA